MNYGNYCMILLICLSSLVATSRGRISKTKKYKCVEVGEDEEVKVVSKKSSRYSWKSAEIKAEREPAPPAPTFERSSREEEEIELPKAKIIHQPVNALNAPPVDSKTPPSLDNVQRDKFGRPLVLAPEHCDKMKKYASMYGVQDVRSWVKANCSFAKMYLPKASCEEINILVASCYKDE